MNVARLGEHAKFLSGFAFKSKFFNNDGIGLPVVRIRDVVRGHSETFYSGEYDERYIVSRGEYLIGMDGEFNLARWQSEKALLNQRVCKIDSISDDVDRDYLGRFLPVALKEIEDATPFVTVKHLSVKALNEIQIPLPPFAEQKRIAGILDAADALRQKRCESLAQLDTLLQSTFLDMFGDPVINPSTSLEDVCELITDGTHQTPTYADEGVKFLSSKNVKTGEINWEDIKFIPESLHRDLHKRLSPRRNDILLAKNGTTGTAAIVDRDDVFDIYVSLALLRPKDSVSSLYLLHAINSDHAGFQFSRSLKGVGVPNLHLKEIRKTRIPLPPLSLQHRFDAIVESVEQQKTSQRAHLDELDTLFASLQSRAFSGKLVA